MSALPPELLQLLDSQQVATQSIANSLEGLLERLLSLEDRVTALEEGDQ